MCLFVPNCSLLKSFRIQNWRRGWDPQCKQSVHMAVIIGNLGPFDERSENLVIMPIDLKHMLRRMTSTMTKKWMFFWLLLVQTLTSRWRICAIQTIRIQRRLHGWRSFFAETLRTCSHCYCWKTQVLDRVTRSESISEFVFRLKKLASSCSFGEFLS